jgi:hypothetical protein
MDRVTRCFLFHQIPGCWPGWTLSIFAVSRQDARDYIKVWHGGGKLISEVTGTSVKADCGGTTEAAQAAIRALNERML